MEIRTERDKTIFVSIACVGNDSELIRTVSSCINNANISSRIHVGINLVYGVKIDENDMYIYRLEEAISSFKNVRYSVNFISYPPSIGQDRNNASALYKNEDYFLQVDAHCFFTKNWDTQLIDSLHSAISMVNNQKTILTATLPKYELNENSITDTPEPERVAFGYGYWTQEFLQVGPSKKRVIPAWSHTGPEMLSFRLTRMVQKTGFAPALKITGSFMFGNKHLAKNISLPEGVIFWEEEIVQSIELMARGFTFVYPYILANIYHYYQIDETNTGRGRRASLGDIMLSSAQHNGHSLPQNASEEMIRNPEKWPDLSPEDTEKFLVAWRKGVADSFESYINNPKNQEKVYAFSRYSGVSFKTAKSAFDFPERYANIGAFPIEEESRVR